MRATVHWKAEDGEETKWVVGAGMNERCERIVVGIMGCWVGMWNDRGYMLGTETC
jgi:hypothetical protein